MKNTQSKPKLSRNWLDRDAFKIVKTLQEGPFKCYLVGGCVRDLLLGISPKDYDIATDARPRQVKKLVRNSYIIGKRFRLVLARRGNDKLFEIATFRRNQTKDEIDDEDVTGDNMFGSAEEDANRRDFTINSLFYDPCNDKLIDYCNAKKDLEDGYIRMIGDPSVRFKEDPIRILRALRLAYKISFSLEPQVRHWMHEDAHTLAESALPRRREEFLKLLRLKDPSLAFLEAYDLGVLKVISPSLHKAMENPDFVNALRCFHDCALDKNNAVELMGHLGYIYIRNVVHTDQDKDLKIRDILEHPEILPFMRDEMGMFKYEQRYIAKGFQLQNFLHKRKEFERKGPKRQSALLRNEAFPLALDFAKHEYRLSGADLYFWETLFEQFQKKQLS